MAEELVGKQLGKYELRDRIGRGGMAEVYKAYHASLDRYVALKVLHPFLSEDSEFKLRFETEARNVARLRHPNIVQVYDFEYHKEQDLYFMVMEYIDGETLRTRLTRLKYQDQFLSVNEAIRVTKDLASALSYAHTRGMIHRDIKPANVMIDTDGRIVLTDFGIARIISGPTMTASGSMVGTPAYMSPEQGLGQSGDHRSDIYSLGVVLYHMLTGAPPYDADTPIAIILKHVNDPLPAPSSLNPEIPEGLERILYKALAKTPEERYQTVDAMSHHLSNLEEAKTIPIPSDLLISTGTDRYKNAQRQQEGTVAKEGISAGSLAQRGGCAGFWLAVLLAIVAMSTGTAMAYTGTLRSYITLLPSVDLVLTATPTESAADLPAITLPPLDTPTPDITATEINLTLSAIGTLAEGATIVPEDPAIGLTETAIACRYNFDVISQVPEDGAPYPEVTTLTKRITIINDSECPLDDDTELVFLDGADMQGPASIRLGTNLQPGNEHEFVMTLRTPPYRATAPVVRSTWILVLPDGTQIGDPISFEIALVESGG